MSNNHKQQQQKPAQTPPAAVTAPEPVEVVEEAPSTALAAAPKTKLALPVVNIDPNDFDARYAEVGESLRAIAEAHPELREALETVALYAVARVEGIEGSTGIPLQHIQIRQGMTKEDSLPGPVKQGELYTKQDMLGPELEFIPLHLHYSRKRWLKGAKRPECTSDDGVWGSRWGKCSECVYGRYIEGSKEAPQCSRGQSVTLVTKDLSRIYHVTFDKTSSEAGRRVRSLGANPLGLYKKVLKLSVSKETNSKVNANYYVFSVSMTGEEVSGARYDAARVLYRLAQTRYDAQVARRAAQGGKGGDNAPALPDVSSGEKEPDFSSEEGI